MKPLLPVATASLALVLSSCTGQLQGGTGMQSSSALVASSSSISSIAVSSASSVKTATGVVKTTGGIDVQYGRQESPLTGFLALPSTDGTHPAVILVHEWWGLNNNIRDMARQFAAQGYVALAVDLYGTSTTDPTEAQKLAAAVRADTPKAMDNLKQAVAFLQARSDVNKQQLASVGWCFGGGWAYQMATNDLGVQATVMYYGQFDPHDDFTHMRASILGHFGEKDATITVDNVKEFQAKLQTASGKNEVYIYPNAGHAFANPDSATYDKAAADMAWARTLEFLQKAIPR